MSESDGIQFIRECFLRETSPSTSCCELFGDDHVEEIEYEEEDQQDDDEDIEEHASDDEDIESKLDSQENKERRRSYIEGLKNNIKWSLNAPETQEESSIKMYLPLPKIEAKDVTTPLEAWSLLFSPNILEIIVQHTNVEIETRKDYSNRKHCNTDVTELKALLGLLYFSGFEKKNHSCVDDIWSIRFGSNLYKAVMSKNRFKFLLACLHFDDRDTRDERRALHSLAPIKEIWDLFIGNCTKYYSPSTNCTIGKQLLEFQSREAKVSSESADKRGIKIITLNDVQTSYMVNAEFYVGRVQTDISESVSAYYIRKLLEPLYNTERNITCDDWFTSVEIAQEMKKRYSLAMVGALRRKKREIPPSFACKASPGTARFAYADDGTLVSYCPTKSKVVLLFSTLHKTGKIRKDNGKPEMVSFYNSTNGATEFFDKLCKTYSTARITHRLPLRLFFGMLDQASVNSIILFNLRIDNTNLSYPSFLKDLAFALMQPHLESRTRVQYLPRNIKNIIYEMLEIKEIPRGKINKLEKRSRCTLCGPGIDKKTKYCCAMCGEPACDEHRTYYCTDCAI